MEELKQGIEAIVEMATIMGHTRNIEKSKFLATTKEVRKTMKSIQMNGVSINLVNDFKLLGHRCIAGGKYIRTDQNEQTQEAILRTRRIATLPVGHMGKIKLLKASPMKVITATNQWAEANPKYIKFLISKITNVVWVRRGR